MSNFRRFITYFFQYENGEKQGQCGYARIEQRQNQGKIDFYIKDLTVAPEEVTPYFFAREGQVKLPIGKLTIKHNRGEGSFRFVCDEMGGTDHSFSAMQGLVIPLDEERMLLSQWEDVSVNWKALRQEQNIGNDSESPVNETVQEEILVMQEHQSAQQTPQKNTSVAEDLGLKLSGLRPKYYPFHGDRTDWAIQAQLRDIKLLPQEYWKLANNSFVMRGYFNYGNILIGYMESEKRFFVGIPGVFQKQERVIAGLFGFDRFRGQQSAEGRPGDFGYWYQLIDVV